MNVTQAAEYLNCKDTDIVKVWATRLPRGPSKYLKTPYVYLGEKGKRDMSNTLKIVSLKDFDYVYTSKQGMGGLEYTCYIDKKNYKAFSKELRKLLSPKKVKVEYAKLCLSPEAEDLLNKHLIPFMNAVPLFRKHKLPISTGVLLYGPPGTGKTSLVNSIATTIYNRYNFNYYEYTGENIRQNAFTDKSCTVLFDDVDVSYFNRDIGGEISNNLLRYLDGAKKHICQIRFFTTNEDLVDVDPAFLRPGRIDRKIYVGPPSYEQVCQYYNNMADEVKNVVSPHEWALQTEGFNFAQMAAIYAYILRRVVLDNVKATVKEAIQFCEFERNIKEWKS